MVLDTIILKLSAKNADIISDETSTITQKTSFASIINKRCQILVMRSVSKLT